MAEGEISINVKSTGASTVAKQLSALELQLVSLAGTLDGLFKDAGGDSASQNAFVDALNTIKENAKETASTIKELEAGTQSLNDTATAKLQEQMTALEAQKKATEASTQALEAQKKALNEQKRALEQERKELEAQKPANENARTGTLAVVEAQGALTRQNVQTARGFTAMVGVLGMVSPEFARLVAISRSITRAFAGATKSITSMSSALKLGLAGGVVASIASMIRSLNEEIERMGRKTLALASALGNVEKKRREFDADAPARGLQQNEQVANVKTSEEAKKQADLLRKQVNAEREKKALQLEQLKTIQHTISLIEKSNGDGLLDNNVLEEGKLDVVLAWGKNADKRLDIARGIPELADAVRKLEDAQSAYAEASRNGDALGMASSLAQEQVRAKNLWSAFVEHYENIRNEAKSLVEQTKDSTSIDAKNELAGKYDARASILAQQEADNEQAQAVDDRASFLRALREREEAESIATLSSEELASALEDTEASLFKMMQTLNSWSELTREQRESIGDFGDLKKSIEEEIDRRDTLNDELQKREDLSKQAGATGSLSSQTNSLTRMGGYIGGVNNVSSLERYTQESAKNTRETATNTKSLYQLFRQHVNTYSTANATFS